MSRFPIAWWVALVVLVSNDHFLKHVNLLPEVLTGKLSDFAGLVVAPVLVVFALRLRRIETRFVAFALVGGVFAAIKLSVPAALLLEQLTAQIGFGWTILVDPTDLIALAALPFAWRMLTPTSHYDRVPTLAMTRAGIVLGGVACLASGGPFNYSTAAWLHNRTEEPIVVRVRAVDATLDCDALRGRETRALGPDAFGEVTVYDVAADEVLPLTGRALARPGSIEASQGPVQTQPVRCEAALVQIDDEPFQLVFWDELTTISVPRTLEDPDDDMDLSGRILVDDEDDQRYVEVGAGLLVAPIEDPIEPSACPPALFDRFEWTALRDRIDDEIVDIIVGSDGCLGIDFAQQPDRLYLCVPVDEFPLEPGMSVRVEEQDAPRTIVFETNEYPRIRVAVWNAVDVLNHPLLDGKVAALDCAGDRHECGSYTVPASFELPLGLRVIAGSGADLPDFGEPESVRVVVGRAESVVVGAADCEPSRAVAGGVADVMVVRKEIEE